MLPWIRRGHGSCCAARSRRRAADLDSVRQGPVGCCRVADAAVGHGGERIWLPLAGEVLEEIEESRSAAEARRRPSRCAMAVVATVLVGNRISWC